MEPDAHCVVKTVSILFNLTICRRKGGYYKLIFTEARSGEKLICEPVIIEPEAIHIGPPYFSYFILMICLIVLRSQPLAYYYADDSQIFSSAKDCTEVNAKLNHDLNNVSQWLVKNKLQHHSTKTKLMYVGSNHNLAKIDNDFSVMINDQLIPRVHSIPCLGVKFDETLHELGRTY